MEYLINFSIWLATFAFMEFFAWFMHKYIMHGAGWFLHKSHHEPRHGWFELNDVYALVFAVPAIVCMYLGKDNFDWLFWVGLGITTYGACYFGFHDIIVHRRLKHGFIARSNYMKRIIRAHKVHHKTMTKEDATSFGFLIASSKYDVKTTSE